MHSIESRDREMFGDECSPNTGTSVNTDRQLKPKGVIVRRGVYFTLVALTICAGAVAMADILAANGLGLLEIAILVLFIINFSWLALSFWSASAGFVIEALGLDPILLRRRSRLFPSTSAPLRSRTAVVMAVCNEDPERVFAIFEAIYGSIKATGHLDNFVFYLLSGTTREEVAIEERRQWAAFCQRNDAADRMFYWKRQERVGRKAGTIADFCRRWGAHYDHMVVLDADSLMEGSIVVELARIMEANPRAALIQTLPMPINQSTLFGRVLQFAGHLYAPVYSSGAAFWQLGESNYYGHNAIIRIKAFTQNCGLPTLPGKPPLGGEILSHDFVEAAYLRRAGWQVYFIPHLRGSYEELPTNILDYAVRDRRWSQGNLQHLKLLASRGLHPINRLHFLTGAFAFIASPLWMIFLLLSTAAMVEDALRTHDYFPTGYTLFPEWPISKLGQTISLFAFTLALLFLPKLLALGLALFQRDCAKRFGSRIKLAVGALFETLFSVLIAPIMMMLHSYFVGCLAIGRAVGWDPQNRSDRGLGVHEAFSSLGILLFAAVAWGAMMLYAAPDRVYWILPVLAGLLVAVPLAVFSSRGRLGESMRRAGYLLTPEEISPLPVIGEADKALVATQAATETFSEDDSIEVPGPLPPVAWTDMDTQPINLSKQDLTHAMPRSVATLGTSSMFGRPSAG